MKQCPYTMKYLTPVLMFLSFCQLNAQTATNTKSSDSSNIYFQALSIHIENVQNVENTLWVEENFLFTDSLPKQIGTKKIEYVSGYEVRELLKTKDELTVIRIVPLRVENGHFFINVIPFKVRKEKRNLRYVNSGGSKIIFTFNCQTNTFHFDKIVLGNI